jgi:lipoteichoic acid synthase
VGIACWNFLREQLRRKSAFITAVILLFLKLLIVTGFMAQRTYPSSDIRTILAACFEWIPSVTVYTCWAAAILAPCFLLRGKAQIRCLFLLNAVLSLLFLFDLWYFRAFYKFTSIFDLYALGNLHGLSSAVLSFIHPVDFLLLIDVLIFFLLFGLRIDAANWKRSIPAFLVLFGFSLGYLLYFNETQIIEENRLFSVRWRPVETISVLSPAGYHIYDLLSYWTERKQLALTGGDRTEINNWFAKNKEDCSPNRYSGLFRGKNLILLQCESLENFVIGKELWGQEITPVLNRIKRNSLYFPNIMEQVGDGTSIDAEFIVNTSLYPLSLGSASLRYPQNRYNSLPKLLEKRGFHTVDIHPDPGSYWNWMEFMRAVGMADCIDSSSFKKDELIGLGLSDGTFLHQAIPLIKKLPQPFYAYLITLTNHAPYDIPVRYRELKLDKVLDGSESGGYLQSVHYMDKQIGIFLSMLESEGLSDNTVVGIFGDHRGIHELSKEILGRLPATQEGWFGNERNIPFLLYKKGMQGKRIEKLGGQIDVLPTITSLMGVDKAEYENTAMGRNLLNTKKNYVVLNDGTFVAPKSEESQKDHALEGHDIADKIIRSNYYGSIKPGSSSTACSKIY